MKINVDKICIHMIVVINQNMVYKPKHDPHLFDHQTKPNTIATACKVTKIDDRGI